MQFIKNNKLYDTDTAKLIKIIFEYIYPPKRWAEDNLEVTEYINTFGPVSE